jgi:hypothetical protein
MNSCASGLLLATLLSASTIVAAQSESKPVADPAVWGIYARLVGTRATSDKYKNTYEWSWEEGGTAIIEDQGPKFGKTRIVPLGGGKLGVSVKDRVLYTGKVQTDGSVVWATEGNFLTRIAGDPYRVRIDGSTILYEYVRVKNGTVEPTSLVVQLNDPQLREPRAKPEELAVAGTLPTQPDPIAPTGQRNSNAQRPASTEAAAPASDVAIELRPSNPVRRKGGAPTEFYRFVAVQGTKVRVQVDTAGSAVVSLYTPEGEAMMRGEGSRSVAAEAYLPSTDVYILSVVRPNASTPYTIKLTSEEPSLLLAERAASIGYASVNAEGRRGYRCWVEPGETYKDVTEGWENVGTLVGDHFSSTNAKLGLTFEYRVLMINQEPFIDIGQPNKDYGRTQYPIKEGWSATSDRSARYQWFDYLCADADKRGLGAIK